MLSTFIVPPMRSIRFLVIAIPSPVPWTASVRLVSSLVNGLNMSFKYSSLIPIPLSDMMNLYFTICGLVTFISFISNVMLPPSSVYLTALDNILISIWLSLNLSAVMQQYSTPSDFTTNVWFFFFACGLIILSVSFMMSARFTSQRLRVVFPDSILLISRTSLIRLSRCWLETTIFSA